jgi:hypothetical protein
LDQWKASVNDAFAKSKMSAVQNQRLLSELSAHGTEVQKTVEELNVRVAELVVGVSSPTIVHVVPAMSTTGTCAAAPPVAAEGGVSIDAVRSTPAPPSEEKVVDDFSGLLDGIDSVVRKRIHEASQAAYYSYADAGPSPHGVTAQRHQTVVPLQQVGSSFSSGGSKQRPRSALLMRR